MPGIGRRSCIGRDGKLQSKEKNICMQMMKMDRSEDLSVGNAD